jgi:hypothetical protein
MSSFGDAARGTTRSAPSSRSGMARTVTSASPRAGGGGGGGFAAAAASSGAGSSASAVGGSSYQSADRLYMTTCDNIEKELRKLTSTVAAAKKQIDVVGTAKDTEDLRSKLCVKKKL